MTPRPIFIVLTAALSLVWAGSAGAASAAEKCQAAKLKAAGTKAKCLSAAAASSVLTGNPPKAEKCTASFEKAFARAEDAAEAADVECPGDMEAIEALVDTTALEVCTALVGLPPSCTKFPATGQTTSFQAGDDGEIQAGAALGYTDNGDGTITDDNTGLQWEKQSDDGSIHDKDNIYTWADAFAVHIAGLNTEPCFAGHCDWRLPNYKEAVSIVNLGNFSPAVSAVFHSGCVEGVTVLNGSCTDTTPTNTPPTSSYWSSTTLVSSSGNAWNVIFINGNVRTNDKDNLFHVRAVRGGS